MGWCRLLPAWADGKDRYRATLYQL